MFLNRTETVFPVTSLNCGQKHAVLEEKYLKSLQPLRYLMYSEDAPLPVTAGWGISHCCLFLYSLWYCCRAAFEPPLSHPCAFSGVKMFHQSVILLRWSHIQCSAALQIKVCVSWVVSGGVLYHDLSCFIHYLLDFIYSQTLFVPLLFLVNHILFNSILFSSILIWVTKLCFCFPSKKFPFSAETLLHFGAIVSRRWKYICSLSVFKYCLCFIFLSG